MFYLERKYQFYSIFHQNSSFHDIIVIIIHFSCAPLYIITKRKTKTKTNKKNVRAHQMHVPLTQPYLYIVSINSASWSTKYEYYLFIFIVQKYLCNSSIHEATHMTSHVISSRKILKINLAFFPMATKTCWFSTNLCTNWFPTNFWRPQRCQQWRIMEKVWKSFTSA